MKGIMGMCILCIRIHLHKLHHPGPRSSSGKKWHFNEGKFTRRCSTVMANSTNMNSRSCGEVLELESVSKTANNFFALGKLRKKVWEYESGTVRGQRELEKKFFYELEREFLEKNLESFESFFFDFVELF